MPRQIAFGKILPQLKDFYRKHRRIPSYSEMQDLFGYRSKGGVSILVNRLLERGLIRRDPSGRLAAASALEHRIRLLGTVQAGFPSPAEEELADTMSLDEFLIKKPEASYLVKVTGDSMIDAGIHPGDLVIVERGRDPKPGDIVIAQVDGGWTMKYFEKSQGKVVLRPANKKYPAITANEEIVIGGVVVANVRKYR